MPDRIMKVIILIEVPFPNLESGRHDFGHFFIQGPRIIWYTYHQQYAKNKGGTV